ncbi:hypothetical protein GCM10010358_61410 [Streptomyces minutiscleroticus]|uniref:Uncharacterized protein n=1 Tax=Streptomyces minutiscleroticus TaxID=68238 RepID=A0A918NW21_9ACTN|nr:hypothetical protein GCM10010358_61410 [Streptomyces minutiscleroticus]
MTATAGNPNCLSHITRSQPRRQMTAGGRLDGEGTAVGTGFDQAEDAGERGRRPGSPCCIRSTLGVWKSPKS